ncbi:MAG: tetratricopeptide repeat protein [Chloroflexota bacterium]
MATLKSVRDRAKAAAAVGDYPLALGLADLVRRYAPGDLETTGVLGQIHLACGRRVEARDCFAELLEIDPENRLARSGLALLEEEDGDPDRAIEQFERVFALDSSNQRVAGEISRLHALLSHTRPTDVGFSQHAIARQLLRRKRYRRSISFFEDALRSRPGAAEIAVGMSQALWLSGRLEEAEEVAEGVLAAHPDCLKALAIVAGAGVRRGETGSLGLLRRTAEMDPGNSVARRLFLEAGLPFPRIAEEPEVPERELWDVVGRLRPAESATTPESEAALAVEDEEYDDEAFWDEEEGEAEPEPFDLPEAQLEGEWVRGRGSAAVAPTDGWLEDWLAQWAAGDALVRAGELRRAAERYLAVLNGMRGISPSGSRAPGDERSVVEKEQDGTNSGDSET